MGTRWQTRGLNYIKLETVAMAFVNEFVSEEDAKKYGLKDIDRNYRHAHFQPEWTIDRERNIYLRQVESGREEYANRSGFTFYWKGTLLHIRLTRRGDGIRGGTGWTEWSLFKSKFETDISGMPPEDLARNRTAILADLKEALTSYKDFGARSSTVTHTATFTF